MDIFEYINFHFGGITCARGNEFFNYMNQLKIGVDARDLEKTKLAIHLALEVLEMQIVQTRRSSNRSVRRFLGGLESDSIKLNEFKQIIIDIENCGESSSYFPHPKITQENIYLDKLPLIFLSHCSKDKKYGDAIQAFLTGLGVKDEQLIYTTHPRHKIPLGKDIFNYLFDNIHQNVFMVLLWSNDYLESTPCLCELGALLVTKGDYVNVFTPEFEMDNPKYQSSPINKNNLGIRIGNSHFRVNMIELKDKIENFLSLENNSENKVASLIDDFIKAVS